MRTKAIFLIGVALLSTGVLSVADTLGVNLVCGYLHDANGTDPANRLPPGTLCILVADLAGDGFDPPDGDWVSGDDVLVTVSDDEFPLANGGTRGFDLASGTTENGFLNRSLEIDLAQFAGRSAAVPVALRWFPGVLAASVNLTNSKPATGSPYGQFFRITPLYPSAGIIGWSLPMSASASLTLDPFVTPELGGQDPAVNSMALWRVLLDGKAIEPRLDLTDTRLARLRFRGNPSARYEVQRSLDLITWKFQASPRTDAFGAGVWVDPTVLLGRAFYRITGPLADP